MPTPTRVAVILLALLGVLLLANGVLTWVGREVIIDRIVETGVDADSAARSVLLFLAAYAGIGSGALLAAVVLPRRRGWARLLGILVTAVLAFLTIFSAVTAGGVSAVSLLVLVCAVAGLTSLMSRQTRDWVDGVTRAR
jgi:hypothetical protein